MPLLQQRFAKMTSTDTTVPQEIRNLCALLKEPSSLLKKCSGLIRNGNGRAYIAIAHFLQATNSQELLDFIVVIQPVVESRLDLSRAKDQYGLTRQEMEVLELVCGGHSNKEISEMLFISEYTTEDHVKNIMRKMGVSSRSKIVAAII